jgi:hypothetical protein
MGHIFGDYYVSGSGILFTPDVTKLLVEHQDELLDESIDTNVYDDIQISNFLKIYNIYPQHFDFYNFGKKITIPEIDYIINNTFLNNIFQYRIKTSEQSGQNERMHNDALILLLLYNFYYKN